MINADASEPKPGAANSPQPMTYRALVHLDSTHLQDAAGGKSLALNAGMLVAAEIQQGQRTVLEYLLSPVRKAAQEAGRER